MSPVVGWSYIDPCMDARLRSLYLKYPNGRAEFSKAIPKRANRSVVQRRLEATGYPPVCLCMKSFDRIDTFAG